MTAPILPPIPPTPNGDSTPAAWDLYLRAVREHNAAAHAIAQQATADAMNRTAAIGEAMQAQPPSPPRLPTRAELVFEMVKVQPQSTVLTDAVVVKGAAGIVDAYVARYPGAVSG